MGVIRWLRHEHSVWMTGRFHEMMRANISHDLCPRDNLGMELVLQSRLSVMFDGKLVIMGTDSLRSYTREYVNSAQCSRIRGTYIVIIRGHLVG